MHSINCYVIFLYKIMKAIVKGGNYKKGIYAAEIDGSADYIIFELLDTSEPETGDVISFSDFYNMGSATYQNQTQQCAIEVFAQNICTASQVLQQCKLK